MGPDDEGRVMPTKLTVTVYLAENPQVEDMWEDMSSLAGLIAALMHRAATECAKSHNQGVVIQSNIDEVESE